jgi:type II secretory pathway pseudopilin PulG
MINLLSDQHKAEIRAGRLNIILFNYIIMSILGIALLGVLLALAFITLSASRQDAQRRVTENETAISQYSAVKSAADSYRSDLATAKQILDKSINYSDLILKISSAIPSGVVLTSLSLDEKTIGTPMTLTIYAKSQALVLACKDSMQTHPELFSDASLQSLELRQVPDGGKDPYTYSAVFNITLNKQALQ